MASITINEVSKPILPSTSITGEEQLLAVNKQGKPATVSVNDLLDKVDDGLADRVEDQVMDQIMGSVNEKIDEKLDGVLDNVGNLTWNDVK
jgi:hypothetical protein